MIFKSFFIESFSNWLTLFLLVLAQFNFKVAMSILIESFSNLLTLRLNSFMNCDI